MKRTIVGMISILVLGCITFAGALQEFVCATPECKFQAKIYTGRGRASTIISGFCTHCSKMVSVHIQNSELKDNRPIPFTKVWDSATGRTLELYECPTCKKPFAPVTQMRFCPKCGKKSTAEAIFGKWD